VSINKHHTDLEEHIVSTLVYFDIFHYPLKSHEVFKFLRTSQESEQRVKECLNDLAKRRRIFLHGDLYSLHADERNCQRRIKGNAEAKKWIKVAEEKAHFIGQFPFVRGVMASGSISKGYMDEKSDLDFFIVTAPGRLWIARTLLVLYKRIFLRNCHKEFCVNYFVDSNHLEIEEKNIFTATELATLIPLYNESAYGSVIASNGWVVNVFPNYPFVPAFPRSPKTAFVKRLLEIVIYPFTNVLDKFFMRISLRRWMKLYGKSYSKEDFDIAFKTKRYVSKNHPNFYQKKVVEQFRCKLAEFENRFEPVENL
jgi:hypothetical protein